MPLNSSNYNRYDWPGTRNMPPVGHTTPPVELGGSERPPVPLFPAPYVPAARFDVHKRANITFSAGLPVSLDAAGNMIPAGIPGGHVFAYTSLDHQVGTGKTRDCSSVTLAAVTADGNKTMNSGLLTHGVFAPAIGIVSYNAYAYEGAVSGSVPYYSTDYDNPANFPVHNTQAQPETLVAITCDYTIQVPYLYGKNLWSPVVKIFDDDNHAVDVLSAEAKSYPFAHDELTVSDSIILSGTLAANIVYVSPNCGSGDDGLTGTILFSGTCGALTFAVSGATGYTQGSAVDISAVGVKVLYDGADSSKYCVIQTTTALTSATNVNAKTHTLGGVSNIKPGDFIAVRNGRYVKWDPARMNYADIFGQALRVRRGDIKRDYLDRVRTAYERGTDPASKLPGTATRGVGYLLNLVTDSAQVQYEKRAKLDGTALTNPTTPACMGSLVINLFR